MIRMLLASVILATASAGQAQDRSERWHVASEFNNALGSNIAYIKDDNDEIWLGIGYIDGRYEIIVQVENPGCFCAPAVITEGFNRVAAMSTDRDGVDGVFAFGRGDGRGEPYTQTIRLRRLNPGEEGDSYRFRGQLTGRELSAVMSAPGFMVRLGQLEFRFNGQGSAQAIMRIRRSAD